MISYTRPELEKLFDKCFGELRGGFILSEEEYDKHKAWSIESGVFEWQLTAGILQTIFSKRSHSS
jgi:hypothetical protein